MTALTVSDLCREGRFHNAVARMQELVRVGDPTEAVDATAVREAFEDRRRRLKSVVQPEPFRVTVHYVRKS